ncbi:MAG: CbiX/SirB N-terminal domain-containing protein, partial [Paracoccus sp. (in: a-proteobacteria)]|nr:CbiX/SirB N-terminal domain-containing protein [Paracoccus sp. (in: a-proteobacteria)]
RSTVLLLAHGSQRARASAEFAAAMAATLAPDFGRVLTGFIEEAPFARDAARGLGSDAICLPLFATRAEHVTKDIPEALDAAGFTGRLLDPVGCAPLVPSLIARAITAAAPRA